jgi:alpha/beta superfamily hydrolase
MSATPTWFGTSESPLLGWLHLPADRRARAGVVICPPLGKEQISAYPTLRVLADRLADQGFAALRFDYEGTGDSAGDLSGASRVEGWLRNVVAATSLLRQAGVEDVALVGLRMGATLAAVAASTCAPLAALVCWDPCVSGRAFLREQRALHCLSVGTGLESAADGGAVEAPGLVYGAATARALKSLTLLDADLTEPAGGPAAPGRPRSPILVITRIERDPPSGLRNLIDGPDVEVAAAPGQAELFDVPSYDAAVPDHALDLIVGYLDERLGTVVRRVTFRPQTTAIVARDDNGAAIEERLQWFGDDGVFGIVTEGASSSGPPVLCLNVATEHHVGPARLWVDLSRRAAASGRRMVRFDYPGVGDSVHARQPGQPTRTYTADSWRGAVDVAKTLCPADPGNVAYLGLCSGAWAAARAAIEIRPRAVYLVNLSVWKRNPTPLGGGDLAAGDNNLAAAAAPGRPRSAGLRRRLKNSLPLPVWTALGRLGVVQAPNTFLRPLRSRGTHVTLILGAEDGVAFVAQRGHPTAGSRAGYPPLRVVRIEAADHSLLRLDGRNRVADEIISSMAADLGRKVGANSYFRPPSRIL